MYGQLPLVTGGFDDFRLASPLSDSTPDQSPYWCQDCIGSQLAEVVEKVGAGTNFWCPLLERADTGKPLNCRLFQQTQPQPDIGP